MRNPVDDIIFAFATALDSIVFNAVPVVVYTIPPDGALGNYTNITSPTTTELGCKTLIGHEATINIEIITQFDGNFATPATAESITDLVLNAIKPNQGDVIEIVGFKMITLALTNAISDNNLFGTNRSYRKILTWSFIVDEAAPWILETGFWNDNGIFYDTALWNDGP